ncbi:MAG TPA: hypothetical protein VME40_18185 [Caulobacteraceae bacterium]|nr:hypothetical protein [Caulobacteraceae bacterium]
MAKAVFQRNQRVWVESVGAWAIVEKIEPVWAKGFEEPVRVSYDVGLGRPFAAHELRAEEPVEDQGVEAGPGWRLMRARNKWQSPEEAAQHPYPGTYPVVVTDTADWGGWRVPGAEYDRDPRKIEFQARLIASAPALRALARAILAMVAEAPDDAPPAVQDLARKAVAIERYLMEVPATTPPQDAAQSAA